MYKNRNKNMARLKLLLSISFVTVICTNFVQAQQPTDLAQQPTDQAQQPTDVGGEQSPLGILQVLAGESIVFREEFTISRVSVGSSQLVTVTQTSDTELLLSGLAAGRTNLIIWGEEEQRKEYQVLVLDQRGLSDIASELTSLLAGIDGIEVKTVGERNIIEGTVYSSDELVKINKVLESYPAVINLAKTGEIYNKFLAEEIRKTIGIEGVDVRYTKSGYILDGIVVSEFEATYAYQIARSFSDNVINALYINPNLRSEPATLDTIRLDLKILEVSTDKFADKANDFVVGLESSGTIQDGDTSGIGTLTVTDPNLRKLAEDSNGRVLVEQSVVVESRKKASLFVGDEIPIPVQQGGNGGLSIEYRDVGLSIDVTPLVYENGTIDLDVSITSSNVIGQAINGGPELSTARFSTSAKVPNNLNVVFAGLISQRDARDFVGTAGNPESSKRPNRFTDDRRQILVTLKPTILRSLDSTMPDMKRSVERSYKDYDINKNKKNDPYTVD